LSSAVSRWRRVQKYREIVHAVVNDRRRVELLDQRQRHRCIKPRDRRGNGFVAQQLLQERFEIRQLLVVKARHLERRMRFQYEHVFERRFPAKKCRGLFGIKRLFKKNDAPIPLEARHEMLRPLIHKIPAQMGKNKDG